MASPSLPCCRFVLGYPLFIKQFLLRVDTYSIRQSRSTDQSLFPARYVLKPVCRVPVLRGSGFYACLCLTLSFAVLLLLYHAASCLTNILRLVLFSPLRPENRLFSGCRICGWMFCSLLETEPALPVSLTNTVS